MKWIVYLTILLLLFTVSCEFEYPAYINGQGVPKQVIKEWRRRWIMIALFHEDDQKFVDILVEQDSNCVKEYLEDPEGYLRDLRR